MDWTSGLDWWTGLVDWTGGDEKIVKKIVHCSIEKIVKKIVQDGKSALVTHGGLHVLITDTAVLLPVSSSEYNSILSMVEVQAEIKKTICIISTQIIVSG